MLKRAIIGILSSGAALTAMASPMSLHDYDCGASKGHYCVFVVPATPAVHSVSMRVSAIFDGNNIHEQMDWDFWRDGTYVAGGPVKRLTELNLTVTKANGAPVYSPSCTVNSVIPAVPGIHQITLYKNKNGTYRCVRGN